MHCGLSSSALLCISLSANPNQLNKLQGLGLAFVFDIFSSSEIDSTDRWVTYLLSTFSHIHKRWSSNSIFLDIYIAQVCLSIFGP